MLYLLFQLGHDRYALPARDVVEVLPYLALPPIPRAAPGVAGLCNYRGRPVPVLDLCALLWDRPARAVLSTRIIIVKAGEPSAPESLLGFIAERATGTLRRDPGDLVGKIPTRMADGGGRSALAGENRGWQIEDGTRPSSREVSPSPPTPPSPAGPTGGEGGRTVGGEGHSRRHPPSSPGAL
ncbi:MAG: chemotaxis protein CheW, partial [Verrucomicrobia bacterium]|nr:chemotaxis protein CheW [Verrucomicrobiota bacterium]